MGRKTKVKDSNKSIMEKINIICYIIVGIILGLYLVGKGSEAIQVILVLFLQFILAYLLIVNIHEFGHYFFGKLSGYQLISYRVGFLSWKKENDKFKFSIIKNKGYSGLCSMIPPKDEISNFKNMLHYAGGILFNVLFGVIFIIIASFFGQHKQLNLFLNYLGISSILLGVVNLLPFMSGNNSSDGKIIWSIILKKPSAEKLIELKRLMTKLSAGTRPSQLEIPEKKSDHFKGHEVFLLLYTYFNALDSKDDENIIYYANLIEENIKNCPTPSLPGLYYELCYVGCITNDMNKAKTYYQKAGSILTKDKDINGHRIKAYYEYYVNQNLEAALTYCEQGLAVKDKFPIKGQALMEEDLINTLIQIIKDNSVRD